MNCAQPGCAGTIVDGYCDVCGLAGAAAPAAQGAAPSASPAGPASSRSATSRLGTVPLGSARNATGSRPTRRLGGGGNPSRLGAGLTHVPPIPEVDPQQSLMNPPVVAERASIRPTVIPAQNSPLSKAGSGRGQFRNGSQRDKVFSDIVAIVAAASAWRTRMHPRAPTVFCEGQSRLVLLSYSPFGAVRPQASRCAAYIHTIFYLEGVIT